jgi:hypothetical protein
MHAGNGGPRSDGHLVCESIASYSAASALWNTILGVSRSYLVAEWSIKTALAARSEVSLGPCRPTRSGSFGETCLRDSADVCVPACV